MADVDYGRMRIADHTQVKLFSIMTRRDNHHCKSAGAAFLSTSPEMPKHADCRQSAFAKDGTRR
jgi:hypothetical protein